MASSKSKVDIGSVSVTRPTLASAVVSGPNTKESLADVKKYLILILKQFLGNKSDDQGVRQFVLFASDLVKLIKNELNALSSEENNELFQEIYEVLSIDTAKYLEQNHTQKDIEDMKHMQHIQARIIDMIKDIFDENSPLMADIYYKIADIKYKQMQFQEGIEFSGLCLKIRIKQLGLLHLKTSDSHYQLGYLYMNLGNYTYAEKETLISRKIRIKCMETIASVVPSSSLVKGNEEEKNTVYLAIADCDYQLTQIEKHLYQYKKTYAYIYSCYHYRKLVLGANNPLTKLASDMTLLHNSVQGERVLCSTELKERATELGQNVQDTDPNVQYLKAVINSISALDDDACLFIDELNELVTSAVLSKAKRNRVHTDDASYISTNQDMIDGILRLLLITSNGSAPSSPSMNDRVKNSLAATMPVASTSSPSLPNTSLAATISSYSTPSSVTKTRSPHSSGKSRAPGGTYAASSSPVETNITESLKDMSIHDFLPPSSSRKNLSKPALASNKQHIVVSPNKHSSPRRHRGQGSSPERKLGDKIHSKADMAEHVAVEGSSVSGGGSAQLGDSVVIMFGDRNTQYIGYDLVSKQLFTTKEVTLQDVVQCQRKEVAALNMFAYIIEKIRSKVTPVVDNSGRNGPKMPLQSPPTPPPLPTSWPPKPYQGESALPADDLSLQGLPAVEDKQTVGITAGPKFKRINGVDQLPVIANTIWADNLESIASPALLFPDIDDQFRSDRVVAKQSPHEKYRASKKLESAIMSLDFKKKQLNSVNTRVLNPQRCQHISIMLAKFGRTESKDIRKGVEDFDIEAIGLTAISSIEKFLPTPEEVSALNNVLEKNKLLVATAISAEATGDENTSAPEVKQYKLDKAEEYLYEMSQVKGIKQKLRAMSVSICARETGLIIENNSDAVLRAIHEVRGSNKFKFVLKSVVDLLNMIGKGGVEGGVAGGVRLSSLNKLSLNKTNSGETLDRYLVYRLIQVIPEIVDMEADFHSLEDAKKVVFETMREELKKLEQGINVMENFNLEDESTVAATRISHHLNECRNVYKVAQKQLNSAVSEYQLICQYFGEDSRQIDPFTLFSTLQIFIRTIQTNGNLAKAKMKRLAILEQHT